MNTWNAKTDEVKRKWWIVDATDVTLGRMATQLANVLRGKNKAIFTPHVDTGDFIVVINADKVKMTGNKWDTKKYFTHSRWFGSLKSLKASEVKTKYPGQIIEDAVWGMLPQNKLGRQVLTKLKVYAGTDHPHAAQKPETLKVN